MTAMADALNKAGFRRYQMEAYTAAHSFIKQGGSLDEWIEVYKSAAGKAREGHESFADKALSQSPTRATQLREEGRGKLAGIGRTTSADLSQPKASEEHSRIADDKAAGRLPPARELSAEDRAARLRVSQRIAVTMLDRLKTSDGRSWGDVGAHELDGMARDGGIAKAIKDKLGVLTNAERFRQIRHLIKPEVFEDIVKRMAA